MRGGEQTQARGLDQTRPRIAGGLLFAFGGAQTFQRALPCRHRLFDIDHADFALQAGLGGSGGDGGI